MRLTFDLESRAIGTRAGFATLVASRRDCVLVEIQMLRSGAAVELPFNAAIKIGVKAVGNFTAPFLAASTSFEKRGAGKNARYTALLNFNTAQIASGFSGEPPSIPALLEVEIVIGDTRTSSVPVAITVFNDIIQGNELMPIEL